MGVHVLYLHTIPLPVSNLFSSRKLSSFSSANSLFLSTRSRKYYTEKVQGYRNIEKVRCGNDEDAWGFRMSVNNIHSAQTFSLLLEALQVLNT